MGFDAESEKLQPKNRPIISFYNTLDLSVSLFKKLITKHFEISDEAWKAILAIIFFGTIYLFRQLYDPVFVIILLVLGFFVLTEFAIFNGPKIQRKLSGEIDLTDIKKSKTLDEVLAQLSFYSIPYKNQVEVIRYLKKKKWLNPHIIKQLVNQQLGQSGFNEVLTLEVPKKQFINLIKSYPNNMTIGQVSEVLQKYKGDQEIEKILLKNQIASPDLIFQKKIPNKKFFLMLPYKNPNTNKNFNSSISIFYIFLSFGIMAIFFIYTAKNMLMPQNTQNIFANVWGIIIISAVLSGVLTGIFKISLIKVNKYLYLRTFENEYQNYKK